MAFGFNSSSVFLGNLIGPLIGSSIAAFYDIKSVFYVTMTLLLINAVLIYFHRELDTESHTIDCCKGHHVNVS